MSRKAMRRTASIVAATALLAGGLAVGAGTAAAAGSADLGSAGSSDTATPPAEQKPHSATKKTDNISVTKKVVGDGTVAPGQKVTYRTVISVPSGVDRLVNKITDFHPAGFEYVEGSAKINAWNVIGGQKETAVKPTVNAADNSVSVTEPFVGWLTSSIEAKTVTLEVSYLVPSSAKAGTALDSGVTFDVLGFLATQKFNPMGVFVTVRDANLVESVTGGSAELGLGSSEGGTGSAGSAIITDPAGFVADVISGVIKNGS
ncbi:hypothetical protein FK531_00185 [Rhodococcus spelaei]|uniref:DUF11 domain-containing protein n=1 Tax=Rhodococcus spelaei TaxID=2546320 RepID=A0A541BQH8_9NOCA|nr:hypothetical protein [Rhodococcus spelaei]TQF74574.1 hypothetical protein FK531_00185 [Rhodococcus spelaei]